MPITDLPHPNWLHLDLKGAVPSEPRLLEWLDWFADLGFNGIVWEYEDRLPWRTWPGTFRPGFDLEAWGRIWARCRQLQLQVIPLVQTQGHLEWVLKQDQWARLREAGHFSELCPRHPEILSQLKAWLDEVIELHSESRFIHLGADETWYLGSCPRCRAVAQASEPGKMRLYLDHVGALCEHAIARNRTPLIWADMFWREQALGLAASLPDPVVLVDWHYGGPGPFDTPKTLGQSGRSVLGASAIRSGYDSKYTLAPLEMRVQNVLGWHAQDATEDGNVDGLIHTTWGRVNSMKPIYGPWEGWVPGFIAGGGAQRWQAWGLRDAVAQVDQCMQAPDWVEPGPVIEQLESLRVEHPIERRAVRWWCLSLRHRALVQGVVTATVGREGLRALERHGGLDPDHVQALEREGVDLGIQVDAWERDARHFWQEAHLGDETEYFDTKAGNLRRLLAPVATSC